MLFSDGTRIGVRLDGLRFRVLRGRGRQARLRAARHIPKYQGGSVIFRGGIMLGGKTDLISFPVSVTARNYVDIVLEPIVRLWQSAHGKNFTFIQDNAPPHTSNFARHYVEIEGIAISDWPPCSPFLLNISGII
ncbi:hypothetical protein HHI36_022302 [Cryptolaemus montrouzieri]|uniref:Transposase n=1 Tax=Cryptolaemus montrouzieri TaxID=559131 RepID=A0ABD2MZT6_9CUCU